MRRPVLLDQFPVHFHLQKNRVKVLAGDIVTLLHLVPQKGKPLVELLVEKLEIGVFVRRNVDFEYLDEPPKQKQHSPEFLLFSQKQPFQVFVCFVDNFEENSDIRLDGFPNVADQPTIQTCP